MEKKANDSEIVKQFSEIKYTDEDGCHHSAEDLKDQENDLAAAFALHVALNEPVIEYPDDVLIAFATYQEEHDETTANDDYNIPIEKQKLGQVYEDDGVFYKFYCPYGCGQPYRIMKTETPIEGVHCGKIHCGSYIDDQGSQVSIPQHATDAQVEEWRKGGRLMTFCGYQFKMVARDGSYSIEKCSNE